MWTPIKERMTENLLDDMCAMSEKDLEDILHRLPESRRRQIAQEVTQWACATPRTSPRKFRHVLVIDADSQSQRLSQCCTPWQQQDFEAMDWAWAYMTGLTDIQSPRQRAYLERPRGHSKTMDLSVSVLCALYQSRRLISGVAAAAKRDQAKLLRDKCKGIVRMNSHLAEELEVQNYVVTNKRTGSNLTIITSDADTNFGQTPDFLILDELVHWKNEDLWDAMMTASLKRSRCVVVVITNAGSGRGVSWKWRVREQCRKSKNWYFHHLEGAQAPWITPSSLEELRSKITRKAYQRLIENQWTTDRGEGLDWADIQWSLSQREGPELGRTDEFDEYVAALDFGIRHDHAALVVLGLKLRERRIILVECRSWKPEDFPDDRISPALVQQETWEIMKRFACLGLAYDPWEFAGPGEWIASQYDEPTHYACPTYPYEPTSKHNQAKVSALLDVMRNRRFEAYPNALLERDLYHVSIEDSENMGRHRLVLVRDEEGGHCDRAQALVIGLVWAIGTEQDYLGISDTEEIEVDGVRIV